MGGKKEVAETSGEGELDRGTWSGKLDFFLSCVGYAVGIGNVWRFPYLCYRNGGATFLIPYIIMLIIAGLPLFFVELAIGQFSSEGPITVWKVSPIFSGIGFGMCIVSGIVSIYYNIIIMYAVYYMFVSFVHLDDILPWQSCNNTFNTFECRDRPYPDLPNMNESDRVIALRKEVNVSCIDSKSLLPSLTSAYNLTTNLTDVMQLNSTMLQDEIVKDCNYMFQSASEQFWKRYVLQLQDSDGIEDIGGISLRNCLCLFFTWILIFFCLIKGIKSTGKVVYFTATFPYIILVILLIRGVTLPGHMKGIEFYVIPQPEKLLRAKVWGDAATQIFYSLGIGFGGLLTMSSYNKFKNNVFRDAILVSCINCGTSIFAGFAIFSLLGFMATETNQDVDKVASQGPGLAFIAYPEGIARLPVAPLWAFLFFFMLLTLGMDSQFAMMETLISGITDVFPHVLRKRKLIFTFCCCMVGFLLGIPLTAKGGIYVMTLMDWYSGSYNLMFLALMEIVCLMYVYGIKKFCEDVEMMCGSRPNWYWLATWMVLCPVALVFIVIISGVQYERASYEDREFPNWAESIGWIMAMLPVVVFVIVFIVQAIRYGGVVKASRSTADWGPALPENRTIPRYQIGTYDLEGEDNLGMVYTTSPPPYPTANGDKYIVAHL
ncbi:hypothetical protein SNE40_021040 [Patella caerulea]|uniref:Transporter n=1 Tax=Patella caerulea TaxID=87958 RepID=A0AAN8IYZ1_PATCE